MKIIANRKTGTLIVGEARFPISNNVRTLQNGLRRSHEVIRSIPDGLPYMPTTFPAGVWKITGVEWQKDKKFDYATYGPVKIRTDAIQTVNVWELDNDGDYVRETSREVKDGGYLLHYSTSKTTLGCIRIEKDADAQAAAKIIEKRLKQGEPVEIEVI